MKERGMWFVEEGLEKKKGRKVADGGRGRYGLFVVIHLRVRRTQIEDVVVKCHRTHLQPSG